MTPTGSDFHKTIYKKVQFSFFFFQNLYVKQGYQFFLNNNTKNKTNFQYANFQNFENNWFSFASFQKLGIIN